MASDRQVAAKPAGGAGTQRLAPLAAAVAAALVGIVGIVAWEVRSINTAINDSGEVRGGPSQASLWVSQGLLVLGVGIVIGLLVGRRSHRGMWLLLVAAGVLAVAVPWLRTDWGLRHAKQQMDAIGDPPGWRVGGYDAAALRDRDGRTVGRVLTTSYAPSSAVTTASLLAHYHAKLPGWTCVVAPDGDVNCLNGSRRLSTSVGGRAVLVVCRSGRDPTAGVLGCGASTQGTTHRFM